MQNNINSLKNENAERTKIMQQLLEERHQLEMRLAAANSGTPAPPVQDRRESSLFCSNNKSVEGSAWNNTLGEGIFESANLVF